jgi:hypothetical protein
MALLPVLEGFLQQPAVGRVELEQAHPVVGAQERRGTARRARVEAQLAAVVVQVAHHLEIALHFGGHVLAPEEARDALIELGVLAGKGLVQRVAARPGVGVDVPVGLVLLVEVFEQLDEHEVLEHVGVVAGVEGVAITQHGVGAAAQNERSGARC